MLTKSEVSAVTVGLLGIAPGGFTNDLETAFNTQKELAEFLMTTGVFEDMYGENVSNESFTTQFMQKMVGTTLTTEQFDQIVADFTAVLDAGGERSQFVENAVNVLQSTDDANLTQARVEFLTKLQNAVNYEGSATNLDDLQGVLIGEIPDEPGTPGETVYLTTGLDNPSTNELLGGTENDDTFIANAGANAMGGISNSLQTGDVIDGGAGNDTLNANIINDYKVAGQDGSFSFAPEPTISNVETLNFRAQENVLLDAGQITGEEEYWSDNSRGDLTITDIRVLDEGRITKDITFGLRDVDFDTNFTALFESQSLINQPAQQTGSQLRINLMDLGTEDNPYTDETPLGQLNVNGFRFTIDGETKEITSQAIDDAQTYAELYAAIQNALANATLQDPDLKGLTVSLEEGAFSTQPQVAILEDGTAAPQTGDSIVIRDDNGRDLEGTTFVQEGDTTEFTLYGRFSEDAPQVVTSLVESNLILDNAGRGSTAGDVMIGGMSNSNEGIEKLNLIVERNSKIDQLNTAEAAANYNDGGIDENGTDNDNDANGGNPQSNGWQDLQEIVVTSQGVNGDLSINKIADVQTFNATAFEGQNLSLGADVGFWANNDVTHTYNTSSANDTLTFNVDNETASYSGFELNVVTGGGDDVVNVVGWKGSVATGNDVNGSATQFADSADLKNVNISTGAGDDEINAGAIFDGVTTVGKGYGAATINAGAGNDFIKTDNGGQKAVFVVNGDTVGTTPTNVTDENVDDGVNGRGNDTYDMFKVKVQVEFMGIKTAYLDVAYNTSTYQTTSRQVNEAIKQAIANDNALSKLLKTNDISDEGLAILSQIDRDFGAGAAGGIDNGVDDGFKVNFLGPRLSTETTSATTEDTEFSAQNTVTETELQSAWRSYNNASASDTAPATTTLLSDLTSEVNDLTANGNNSDYGNTDERRVADGSNSTALTMNDVTGGSGDDVIVLSTNTGAGYDTVHFTEGFGHDTIINFNSDTVGGTSRDVLDFTAFLDRIAANRFDNGNTAVPVDERHVDYTFTSGLTVGAAGVYHNAVSMAAFSDVYTAVGAASATQPENVAALSAEQVTAALNQTNNAASDSLFVGMKSVIIVRDDQHVAEDGSLIAAGDDANEFGQVFSVEITGVQADGTGYTYNVVKQGTFQLAEGFSNLADLGADNIFGTAAWQTAENDIDDALGNPTQGGSTGVTIADAPTDGSTYSIQDSLQNVATEATDDTITGSNVLANADTITAELTSGNEVVTLTGLTAEDAGTPANATAINFTDDAATLTASELNTITNAGLDVDSGDTLTVNTLVSSGVVATSATETFVFDDQTNGISITNFAASTDKIDLTGLATAGDATLPANTNTTDGSSDATFAALAANTAYFVDASAGNAETAADVEAALNGIDPDGVGFADNSGDVAYIFATDADSTAIYAYTEAGTDGAQAGELALIGTVDAVLTAGDLATA